MAEWKERGYVPDSDDDEDEELTEREELEVHGDDHRATTTEAGPLQAAELSEPQFNEAQDPSTRETTPVWSRENDRSVETSNSEINDVVSAGSKAEVVLHETGDRKGISSEIEKPRVQEPFQAEAEPAALEEGDIQQFQRSVVDQLQTELKLGLDIVKDVLRKSPLALEDSHDGSSDLSSPLSSIQSPLSQDQPSLLIALDPLSIPAAADHQPIEQHNAEVNGQTSHHGDHFELFVHQQRRSLRQRNAIQLHPYMLEDLRYRNELRARGMQPFSVPIVDRQKSATGPKTHKTSSQSSDEDEAAEAATSPPESSSPLWSISERPFGKRSESRPDNKVASDEELPDLDAILDGRDGTLPRMKKAQRFRKSSKNLNLGAGHDEAIFYVPPSPPNSGSNESSQPTKAFAEPSTLTIVANRQTPQALPTPRISSAAQVPTVLSPHLETAPDSTDTVSEGSGRSSSPDSPEREDTQILRLQRKTKGVLPASFIRLQRQQASGGNYLVRQSPRSPGRDRELPGIAHRLSRPGTFQTSPSRARPQTIVVSDDTSSEEGSSTEELDGFSQGKFSKQPVNTVGMYEKDIEEDNSIDILGQPQSKRRRQSAPVRKRQRRISEFGSAITETLASGGPRRSSKRRKGPSHPDWGSRRQKQRLLRTEEGLSLGPLDAPDYTNLSRQDQPYFVRVAARRAKSRKSGGRQGPGRKFIQLATKADTHDATHELRNWRTSIFHQSSIDHSKPRPPDPRLKGHDSPQQAIEHKTRARLVSRRQSATLSISGSQMRRVTEQRSAFPRETEDVIRGILARQSARSVSGLNASKSQVQQSTDNDTLTRLQPPALLHAGHLNRSGRGTMLVTAKPFAKARDAQMEDLVRSTRGEKVPNTFRGRLATSGLRKGSMATDEDQTQSPSAPDSADPVIIGDAAPARVVSRNSRKRPPRRLLVTPTDSTWQSGPGEPVYSPDVETMGPLSGVVLAGLGSPEFPITDSFGIAPFREGTHLHETTFIGQGHLRQVIRDFVGQPRNLIRSTSHISTITRPSAAHPPYHWGIWTDDVSRELSEWLVELRKLLNSTAAQGDCTLSGGMRNSLAAVTSLTTYLSSHLSFASHEAIRSFAKAIFPIFQELTSQLECMLTPSTSSVPHDVYRLSYMLLIVLFELGSIGKSGFLDDHAQLDMSKCFKSLSLHILRAILQEHCLVKISALSNASSEALSIEGEYPEIEAFIVMNLLSKQAPLRIEFWDVITDALLSSIKTDPENLVTFQGYDRWWKGIYVALPLLEMDASGLVCRKSGEPGWDLAQRLLSRFFSLFMPRRHRTGYSTRRYGRILLQRCLDLVQHWGWQGGHLAVGALFDVYGYNDLGELFGETPEQRFCIPFNIAPSQRIHVDKTDSGFHAFLGFTAETILCCRRSDADAKLAKRALRSLSARLVPTKGKDLPRDRTPSLHDVVALRNRFDLVSVMYCAMPTDMKPSLRQFRALVDFRIAHREACKIALDCWVRLAQHQISDDNVEVPSGECTLDQQCATAFPLLREWHDSMTMDLLTEYDAIGKDPLRLVGETRPDPPEQRQAMPYMRKQVAELVKDALQAWQESFDFCQNVKQVAALFSHNLLSRNLSLFNVGDIASNTIVLATLAVIKSCTMMCAPRSNRAASAEEDSQEYGSWDDLDAMDLDGPKQGNLQNDDPACLLLEVQALLWRFVSNIFGGDIYPEHAVLTKTAECWFEVADALVRVKARSWDHFIGGYSSNSWDSLPNTRQSQQYKVYFLSKIVDSDQGFYESNCHQVLEAWVSALCRPAQMLCWEHLLTSVILFHDSENELLFNPPFAVRSSGGDRLDVSPEDLRARRTAMIYVVLRNMHRMVALPMASSGRSFSCDKAVFLAMLKRIEATMKTHYQGMEADTPAQLEYRAFVQFVVQQMQLYVVDFYKIDVFFSDPMLWLTEDYVVTASLKRYSLTIETTGISNAMVLFLYNAGERAAVHDKHQQFVFQLQNAFLDLSQEAVERTENYDADAMLLGLFMQHVFPAYISQAFSTPGHLLARPILQLLTHVYQNLRCRANLWSAPWLRHLTAATEVIFCSAITAFRDCDAEDIQKSTNFLTNFNDLVEMAHAAMLRIDEVAADFPHDIDTGRCVELLLMLRTDILAVESPPQVKCQLVDLECYPNDVNDELTRCEPSVVRAYAERELQSALDKTWERSVVGTWQIVGRGPSRPIRAMKVYCASIEGEEWHELQKCWARTRAVVGEFVEACLSVDGRE